MIADKRRLLIAVAINEEFKTIKKAMDVVENYKEPFTTAVGSVSECPVELVMTSMGMEAARSCAHSIIDPHKHGGVLVLGYCGGLSHALKLCDAVVPSKIINAHGGAINIDSGLIEKWGRALICEGLHYRSAPLLTQSRVIEKPEEKMSLYQNTFAEAVDMETYEILDCARSKNLPVAAMKVVIDDVDTELPSFNDYFEKTGKMNHLGVKKVLMGQPALSLKLSQNMKKASAVLQEATKPLVSLACQHWNLR